MGESIKDPQLCDRLFACPTPVMEILAQVKDVPETSDFAKNHREPRGTCEAVTKLCPGVSIGCALCGLFIPGTCGDHCIVAGIYCGTSAFACKAEALKTPQLRHIKMPAF